MVCDGRGVSASRACVTEWVSLPGGRGGSGFVCSGFMKTSEWASEVLVVYVVIFVLCCGRLCSALCSPPDCNPPGSPVRGLSRQGYWSGFPCPSPGHLPDPGIKPVSCVSCVSRRIFTTEPPRTMASGFCILKIPDA